MQKIRPGHYVIEFALVFPFLILVSLGGVDLMLLALQHLALEYQVQRATRDISRGCFETNDICAKKLKDFLDFRFKTPSQVQIQSESLRGAPPASSFRKQKTVDILKIQVEQQARPWFFLRLFWEEGDTLKIRVRTHGVRIS